MAQYPNPDILSPDVVQEVIGKALEITAPKSAPIKMEAPGIFSNPADSDLKFREEILTELNRNIRVHFQDLVQIRLNPLVESNFHRAEAQRRVRQK
jgi:hypothetical protein